AEEHHRPARARPAAERVMDLSLNEDQRLLAESARQLFERTYTTESARAAEDAPDRHSRERRKQAGALGAPGIALPQAEGGGGVGPRGAAADGFGVRVALGGPVLIAVASAAPGIATARHDTFAAEPFAAVTFTDVAVSADDVVGDATTLERALAHQSVLDTAY